MGYLLQVGEGVDRREIISDVRAVEKVRQSRLRLQRDSLGKA